MKHQLFWFPVGSPASQGSLVLRNGNAMAVIIVITYLKSRFQHPQNSMIINIRNFGEMSAVDLLDDKVRPRSFDEYIDSS